MKRIAGSVELGEGFSEDWERASLERRGVEKAEIDRIAPAVASEMVGPRTLDVEIAVDVSMMVGSGLSYMTFSKLTRGEKLVSIPVMVVRGLSCDLGRLCFLTILKFDSGMRSFCFECSEVMSL